MKVFSFNPPYKASGRTSFPETKSRSGVYLIKENDKLVYIGFSASDLYKTLYRHFQQWTDTHYKTQKVKSASDRVTYVNRMARNKYTVRVIFCTAIQAEKLERALIKKHKPRDNEVKYDSYQLDLRDKNLVTDYMGAPVVRECPF